MSLTTPDRRLAPADPAPLEVEPPVLGDLFGGGLDPGPPLPVEEIVVIPDIPDDIAPPAGDLGLEDINEGGELGIEHALENADLQQPEPEALAAAPALQGDYITAMYQTGRPSLPRPVFANPFFIVDEIVDADDSYPETQNQAHDAYMVGLHVARLLSIGASLVLNTVNLTGHDIMRFLEGRAGRSSRVMLGLTQCQPNDKSLVPIFYRLIANHIGTTTEYALPASPFGYVRWNRESGYSQLPPHHSVNFNVWCRRRAPWACDLGSFFYLMKWPAVSLISEPNAKVTNVSEGLTLSSTGLVRWDAFVAGSSAAATFFRRGLLESDTLYHSNRRIGSAFKDHVRIRLGSGANDAKARDRSYVTDQIIIPCLTSFQNVNTRFLRSLTNYHSIDVNRGGILLPKQINGLSIPGASIDANALFGLGPAPTPTEKTPKMGGKPKASGQVDKTRLAVSGGGDDKPDPDDEDKGDADDDDADAPSGSGEDEEASTESEDGPALAISTPKPGPSGVGKKRGQEKKTGKQDKGPPSKKGRPEQKKKVPTSKKPDATSSPSEESPTDEDPAQKRFDTMSEKVELEIVRLQKTYNENHGDIMAALADLSETAANDPAQIDDALAGLEGAFSEAEEVPPALNTARRRMERTVKSIQSIAKKQAEEAAKNKKTSGPLAPRANPRRPPKQDLSQKTSMGVVSLLSHQKELCDIIDSLPK
ncbi:Hypothetical protein FKW44_018779 [Caligus rogercresseyi]|uniref:Uncharacterized protein n=1 Tax=Caligus rogercresseyi TaxID=217165 RepID=A0A7T8GVH2_CALRO|nr:Hypothetical protein FKW44_018779 [Caligus rogercresseyi]